MPKHETQPSKGNINVIIGNNGSGKSALLEGVLMALSAFFIEFDEVSHRKFSKNDIRYEMHLKRPEYQLPVVITSMGSRLDLEPFTWHCYQEKKSGDSYRVELGMLGTIAQQLQKAIAQGNKTSELPLISYFPANRFLDYEKNTDEESDEIDIVANKGRLEAYDGALSANASYKQLKKWFISKEIASLQQGYPLAEIKVVKKAVSQCIEGCKDVSYNIDATALIMEMEDGRVIRWGNLSDGQRSMLALVADIAYRCINLNPQLGENALETSGIVLIDELDVHLHPNWQKNIASLLKKTFPNVQFIVTTHSPLILHSLELGDRIITLEDNTAYYFDNEFGRDVDDTLQQIMGTKIEVPHLSDYLEMIESGNGNSTEALELREKIEALVGSTYKELAKADALLKFYTA